MKCKKCGLEIDSNDKTCKNCGLRIEEATVNNVIDKKEEKETKEKRKSSRRKKKEDSPFMTLFLVIITVCVCFGGFTLYNKLKGEDDVYFSNLESRIIDYKEKGYTVIEVENDAQELDRFSLINNSFNYSESDFINQKNSKVCNTLNSSISYLIVDGILTISYKDYNKTVDGIEAKYILDYNKQNCECKDYNVAVLSKDGYIYTVEMEEVTLTGKALVDYLATNFKKVEFKNKIKSFSVSVYVGEANPCTEKVLVLLDEHNITHIYRNNEIIESNATYASKIYNVIKDKQEYVLYINPDRTMQLSDTTNDEGRYIMDDNGISIKYFGMLSSEDGKENYILSTTGILYSIEYNNLNTFTAYPVRNLLVKNVGYKFDINTMIATYAIIYEDGSSREYKGKYESHGLFTIK